ncbi:hypothetical protein I4U23_024826 [Adineta vaga]|nr:hypothetical protein I4U23_024826 [Adineta vaga]
MVSREFYTQQFIKRVKAYSGWPTELFVLLNRNSNGQEEQTDQQNICILCLNGYLRSLNQALKKTNEKEKVMLTHTRTKDNKMIITEKMAQDEKKSSITEFDEEQERERKRASFLLSFP